MQKTFSFSKRFAEEIASRVNGRRVIVFKIWQGGRVVVPYFSDMQDIGMFKPSDIDALRRAFEELAIREGLGEDDTRARAMARSLIQLYRHGVRDPENLVSAISGKAA